MINKIEKTDDSLKILYKSICYTDYISEFVLYKKHRYKIVAQTLTGNRRINVHIYLLSDNNMVEIAKESDLSYNTNDYYMASDMASEKKFALLKEELKHAEEFIVNVYS